MMKGIKTKDHEIKGHLDIIVEHNEDEDEGVITQWDDVLIHGDPEGLKSFANLILKIANVNQNNIDDSILPKGAREHYHLRPGIELSKSSVQVILGRLDAKGTGEFYDSYIQNEDEENEK